VNLIALAIPAFFLFIAIELVAAKVMKRDVYRFSDSIADLSCGVTQQVVTVFLALVTVAGYKTLQSSFGYFEIPTDAWWAWLLCFLGVDLCYYWFHRLSHEIAFLWGAHVVHHQSEEYNLTVALRQSAFQPGFSWLFYLPLALLGFPPLMFFTVAALNTLYQFWIHTRLIGRMGPLEWIINTPSHHRVHHGRNAQYIDRNHAGSLIIWDKLFGTFEPEGEEVIYGVNDAIDSYSPIWANFHYYVHTWRRARAFPRVWDRVKVWFMLPGWTPEGVAKAEGRALTEPKYDPPAERRTIGYVLGQFALLVGLTVGYLFLRPSEVGWAPKILLGVFIVLSVTTFAGLLESRRWARTVELLRPTVLVIGAVVFVPDAYVAVEYAVPAVLYVVLSAVVLLTRRGEAAATVRA
jgi:alkylglycerol monooxygenase